MNEFHMRLTEAEVEIVRRKAADLSIPMAPAIRRLIRESAIEKPPVTAPGPYQDMELDMHLLVALEQVIALIESFLPEGSGAARRVLPEAVMAAQRRLAAADDGWADDED